MNEFEGPPLRLEQHTGVDIPGDWALQPNAPRAVNVVPGVPLTNECPPKFAVGMWNVDVCTGGGVVPPACNGWDKTYVFAHLAGWSCTCDFAEAAQDSVLESGVRIAKLGWFAPNYHHLHYEIHHAPTGTDAPPFEDYLNPLAEIVDDEGFAPVISEIHFAADDAESHLAADEDWSPLVATGTGGCVKVSGRVDIVPRVYDRDTWDWDSKGRNTFVSRLRWRACSSPLATEPECHWNLAHSADRLPYDSPDDEAQIRAQFSTRKPWKSKGYYGAAKIFYPIVTNVGSSGIVLDGAWDTTSIPVGTYYVQVEALDFATPPNTTVKTVTVCVEHP